MTLCAVVTPKLPLVNSEMISSRFRLILMIVLSHLFYDDKMDFFLKEELGNTRIKKPGNALLLSGDLSSPCGLLKEKEQPPSICPREGMRNLEPYIK